VIITNFIYPFMHFMGKDETLLVVQSFSLCFKIIVLGLFLHHILRSKSMHMSWIYLFILIISGATEDLSWVVALTEKLFLDGFNHAFLFARIAWTFNIVMYYALFLFIESFRSKKPILLWHHYIFGCISFGFFITFIYFCLKHTGNANYFEQSVRGYESLYAHCLLIPFALGSSFYSLRNTQLPHILKLQLQTCLKFFLLPHAIGNLFQVYPFKFALKTLTNNSSAVGFSAIFMSLTIYQCIKRIIGLRFLDLHEHVHDDQRFNFVKDFKSVLENLGKASNGTEIKLLTQHFFHKAFGIAPEQIFLSIRSIHTAEQKEKDPIIDSYKHTAIETFIEIHNEHFKETPQELTFLQQNKIIIYDELAYNHFHEPTETQNALLSFLEKINADIFLPIYENNIIIAYITVQRFARNGQLYTNVDRDEMLVYASYLSKIINLLQNRNLNEIFKQKKEMLEELYIKHQEVNRYKESIRSFLRSNNDQSIGVFFYKSRRFVFGNKNASEMLGIDPNAHYSNPLTKKLKAMVNQITSYKSSQTLIVTNDKGKRLVIQGMLHPEVNGAIFVVHYPEISDTIKHLLDTIKDPSDWDYLLYLETTESGRLVNTLIPSNDEPFIDFKIDLLKSALSKKALLLSLPKEDLTPTVEILHHISLRESLHILELDAPITTPEIPISLFGINNLFGSTTSQPLLEKLNKKGTLAIKNIHFLDLNSQNNLAECIKYGFYKVFKSNKKMQTDIRIIVSSNQDLKQMVQEGTFSQALYNELKHTYLTMPSLLTLESNKMDSLVEGFANQALANDSTANILDLTDKDKIKIFKQKPASLYELKRKVESYLITKSKNDNTYEKTRFNPAYNVSDPHLAQAAQMGKHALKDAKVMSVLWNKFKNQNKIAEFLGVNRSSVHRRCKDYGLL
jgi:hypothetical protein